MQERFRNYEVRRERWSLGGMELDLAWPADMDVLLDAPATQERFRQDEYMPYWAQPWPGAILLAETLTGMERGNGRGAIEIGCGVGVVSLVAAKCGWNVVASDYDEDAIAFAEWNAARNGIALAACRLVDYRVPLESPEYDLVLGSDLLYERKKSEPVAAWVSSALRPGGLGLLSDPNRAAAEEFPEYGRRAGMQVETITMETVSPAGLVTRGRVFRLTRLSERV